MNSINLTSQTRPPLLTSWKLLKMYELCMKNDCWTLQRENCDKIAIKGLYAVFILIIILNG
jgi:hypothetical protein